jgi:hypothetical protein
MQLFVELADGRQGLLDMQPFMRTDYFRELENPAYFAKVQLFFDGIGWPNGQDLGPDTVAAELQPLPQAAARA